MASLYDIYKAVDVPVEKWDTMTEEFKIKLIDNLTGELFSHLNFQQKEELNQLISQSTDPMEAFKRWKDNYSELFGHIKGRLTESVVITSTQFFAGLLNGADHDKKQAVISLLSQTVYG